VGAMGHARIASGFALLEAKKHAPTLPFTKLLLWSMMKMLLISYETLKLLSYHFSFIFTSSILDSFLMFTLMKI
jgi:hypothetical protein